MLLSHLSLVSPSCGVWERLTWLLLGEISELSSNFSQVQGEKQGIFYILRSFGLQAPCAPVPVLLKMQDIPLLVFHKKNSMLTKHMKVYRFLKIWGGDGRLRRNLHFSTQVILDEHINLYSFPVVQSLHHWNCALAHLPILSGDYSLLAPYSQGWKNSSIHLVTNSPTRWSSRYHLCLNVRDPRKCIFQKRRCPLKSF